MKNRNVLYSEALLIEEMLRDEKGKKILSIGCGSGLFEYILKEKGIRIEDCVEPSEMGKIAEKRGLKVKRGYAEKLPIESESYDIVLLNGVIHYLKDPIKALNEIRRVLKPNGNLVLCWVTGEGSYGLLYRLASILKWEKIKNLAPEFPYPEEFIREALWPTVEEVRSLLRNVGFKEVKIMQTLTTHPKYSNNEVESPSMGYEKGDYICIKATKVQNDNS
ncbi:methyltransferase domain-containing protein [Sulfolobus sp. E5-1-F]|uniref:class I SAM-dependent methyltransferase n=1 Tax=Sulfolobaceae TaxID=118883 RepID=UPI0012979B66|nr:MULTISPECIES: class I SAM-dependent methyltransferase [unclassified Sulfolobus]QGA53678.1 methyltransferase domain-containing protein [Sulfolobus sp. E5-1-F]QGA68668.1 methyltransferase domain-containing protein [Sulfolobus sp. E11-6]